MAAILIVTAGVGKARFLAYLPPDSAEARAEPALAELESLTVPVRPGRADRSKPGLARKPGAHAQAFDEHTNQQKAAAEAAFGRSVAERAAALAGERRATRLVLVAGPHLLGALRPHMEGLRRSGMAVDELPKDLIKLSKAEILSHLDAAKMVPQPGPIPPEAAKILGPRGEGEFGGTY